MVSTIITTHNRLKLLKKAVKSVYAQTYPNIELIVVDDASDDGVTETWCREQSQHHKDFFYIHIKKEESKGNEAYKPAGRQRYISNALKSYSSMVTSADKGGIRVLL